MTIGFNSETVTWLHETRISEKICYNLKLGILSFWGLFVYVQQKNYKYVSQRFYLAKQVTKPTYFAKQTHPCADV